jgi:uncharacterized protein
MGEAVMPTALITGPTSGLGRAFAEALAYRGHDLVLVARDGDRLAKVADELSDRHGVSCETLPADLTDPPAFRHVEERLAGASAGVDILVNNAGFGLGRGFLKTSIEDEQRLLDVHVRAVMRLTRAAVPGMVERGSGTVINVSSVAGFVPFGTYGAAKAWVTSFTEGLAAELTGTGVQAVVVCPGFTRTEFHARSGVTPKGIPRFMWLSADDVIDETLRHVESGKRSPVVVPSRRYKLIVFAARHVPRKMIRRASANVRARRNTPSVAS